MQRELSSGEDVEEAICDAQSGVDALAKVCAVLAEKMKLVESRMEGLGSIVQKSPCPDMTP